MKSEKKIAILMAIYNGEKYIKEQIDSLVSQSYDEWELFIRDDGSKDQTLEIIKDYIQTHQNIHLLEDELGSLGTRDQFLHMMDVIDAEYYMYCDQDDVWIPSKIERSYARMRFLESKYPDKAILVGSDCYMCDEDLNVVNNSCWDHLRIDPDKFLTYQGICVYPFVTGASMILNKKVKEFLPSLPANLPKNRPMYDWWVLINTYKYGIVDLIKEPTRYYRQHTHNVSGGLDKLNTSYWSKLSKLKKVYKANQTRAEVLKLIGYGSMAKYYFFKLIYLLKMMKYKHK